jgi:hypothetical protein
MDYHTRPSLLTLLQARPPKQENKLEDAEKQIAPDASGSEGAGRLKDEGKAVGRVSQGGLEESV